MIVCYYLIRRGVNGDASQTNGGSVGRFVHALSLAQRSILAIAAMIRSEGMPIGLENRWKEKPIHFHLLARDIAVRRRSYYQPLKGPTIWAFIEYHQSETTSRCASETKKLQDTNARGRGDALAAHTFAQHVRCEVAWRFDWPDVPLESHQIHCYIRLQSICFHSASKKV